MSSISRRETVTWFTTPDQLRKIAAKMDDKWANATLGQDLTADVIWSESTELRIVIAQEKMKRA